MAAMMVRAASCLKHLRRLLWEMRRRACTRRAPAASPADAAPDLQAPRRCDELGSAFHWSPGARNPVLFAPDGDERTLEVEVYCPMAV